MQATPAVTVFLSLAFIFCLPWPGLAQNCKLSIGPSASVDRIRVLQDVHQVHGKTKYSAGIGIYFWASERFVVKSGLLYSRKGNALIINENHPFSEYMEKMESKANYLDIPVLAGYKVAEAGKWSVVPAAGFISSIRLNASFKRTYADGRVITDDYGLGFGFGLNRILALELGLNYQASDKIQLGLSPYYRPNISFRSVERGGLYGTTLDLRYCL